MKFLIPALFGLFAYTAHGELDLNRNGYSELWELLYPSVNLEDVDTDSDGFSNRDEATAGTDPESSTSFLTLEVVSVDAGQTTFRWQGVAGKGYRIEQFIGEEWIGISSFLPRPFGFVREAVLATNEEAIYRVVAHDLDLDQDGLSSWEEAMLGWSDSDAYGSGDLNRMDFASALRRLESPDGFQLSEGGIIAQRLPTRAEASRFLIQASFGPTTESIDHVTSIGLTGWLDDQTSLAPTLSATTMWRNGLSFSSSLWRNSWWKLPQEAPDQLRQRVAYALSQIFVVNYEGGNNIGNNPLTQSVYYDSLIKRSFGDYRSLLNDVTYSPVMGFYLSHLRNRKSDPELGRFPDENFAREIMQLFSIGLWELHQDGTRQLDHEGNFVPTYDNSTITEMAKIFTGMSFSNNGVNRDPITFSQGVSGNAYLHPMLVYEEEHEQGPKTIIGGVTLNDVENGGASLTGEEEVQLTLNALASHPNTAPFISHLLIQRFTSSNPRPEYIQRVSEAWNGTSGSEAGRFDRVVEAILLDPDARSQMPFGSGKIREPLLRLTHLMRAFQYDNGKGEYKFPSTLLFNALGQYPMHSKTVFNFYQSSYIPSGELSETNSVSPEMQIMTDNQLINSDNFFKSAAEVGYQEAVPDYSVERSLVEQPELLLDHLEGLLCSRPLTSTTRAILLQACAEQETPEAKVQTLVHLIVASPEAAVLE